MKILLIYPYFIEPRVLTAEDVRVVPSGVYYVAAVLKENGYDIEILNWYNIDKTPHKIREILTLKKPDAIGFSILHANRWGGIEIARIAKQIDSCVTVVFGGIGATFLWKQLLTHFPDIDFVVMGEEEFTFLNLINYLASDRSHPVETIAGIAFRQDGRAIRTEPAEPVGRLDDLPAPARYFSYQHLSLTRGCDRQVQFLWISGILGKPGPFALRGLFRGSARTAPSPRPPVFLFFRRYLHHQPPTGHRHLQAYPCQSTRYQLGCHFPGGLHG